MARLMHKTVAGMKVVGFSLAGEETVVAAPEFNVCFDVGRAPREIVSIDNLCLTHGHMDHAAGVAYYLSQRGFIGAPPGRVIVPRHLVGPLEDLMHVWARIEGHRSPGQIVGVEPLEDVEIRRNLLVRPFAVNHGGGALGFTLIEVRHKLKPELAGKLGPELVEMKKRGEAIEDRVEIPLITYTGDTALGRFLDHGFVQRSQALIVECTFFEDEHRSRAYAGKHLHVEELPRVLEACPDSEVLIIHLTRRTDLRFAKRVLESVVSEADMRRITLLMERPPRRGGRRPAE